MYPTNVLKREPALEFRQCNCLFLSLSQWYIYIFFLFVVVVDFRFCFNISSVKDKTFTITRLDPLESKAQ